VKLTWEDWLVVGASIAAIVVLTWLLAWLARKSWRHMK